MKLKNVLSSLLCIIFITSLCVLPASASAAVPVKVGYFHIGDYYKVENDKGVSSYDSAYLEKIAQYTDLQYEYVDCGTWANALKMLENHEIDLLGTMQLTPERQNKYAFCSYKYGITYASIAALPTSNFLFEDYERIGQSKVGCVKGYVRTEELKQLFAEKGVSPELVYFDTVEELENALESGAVDLAAQNFHSQRQSWSVVERYCFTPYYFVTWKGNEKLAQKIDEALLTIELYETTFRSNMMSTYFTNIISAPFTREEYDFIAQSKPIDVYLETDSMPVAYLDKETDEISGIIVDICELISEKTGLKFNYRPVSELTESKLSENEAANHAVLAIRESGGRDDTSVFTEPLYECNYYLYENVRRVFNGERSFTVAIPKNYEYLISYFTSSYHEYEVVRFDSSKACIESIQTGKTDFALLDYEIANAYLARNRINNVINFGNATAEFFTMLELRGEDRNIIASIINKGIYMFDDSQIQHIMLDYAIETKPDLTLQYVIHSNPLVLAIITIVVFLIALSATAIFARFRMLKHERIILKKANEDLEQASKAKSEFLTRMSHDIRTPMNAIIGMTALARDQTKNPAALDGYLKKIQISSSFLLGLINDILDMSKIECEALKLNPEPYTVEEFAEQVDVMAGSLCEQKDLRFVFKPFVEEHCVLLDKLRFNQIFFNLLSNAIKFTPRGGRIDFVITQMPKENGRVKMVFVVRDTGIGMSKDFLNHLYEPFAQENEEISMSMGGTGLGLAIVKNLVTLMDGAINVKSEPLKGTEFTVVLEAEICKAPRQGSSEDSESSDEILRGKTVLLCEDNEMNTEIAVALLEKKGVKIEAVTDGNQGVEKFAASEENYYDAVLMDIRMPVMDGLTASETIRCMDRADAKSVPIIAMTANAYASDVEKSLAAGMNAHLAKPIEPVLLYRKLTELIKERNDN